MSKSSPRGGDTRVCCRLSSINGKVRPGPGPGAKTVPPVRRQSGRRDRAEIQRVSERFYEAVVAHPGQTMVFLAAKLELRPQELHRPMDLLRQARKIRSVGQRNFTKYFPMAAGEVAAA